MDHLVVLSLLLGQAISTFTTAPCGFCRDLFRLECVSDGVCGECMPELNLAGNSSGNAECENKYMCRTTTDCGDNGFCRSDGTCTCNPGFSGPFCEIALLEAGVGDLTLAGVIILWMLIIPVCLFGCLFYFHNKFGDLDMPGQNAGARGRPAGRRAPAGDAAARPANARGFDDVELGGVGGGNQLGAGSGAAAGGAAADPPNAEAMTTELLMIVPQASRQEAQRHLKMHNWDLVQATNSLLESACT